MSRAPNAERAKQDESLCSALLTDSSRQICGVKKALPIVVRLQVLSSGSFTVAVFWARTGAWCVA